MANPQSDQINVISGNKKTVRNIVVIAGALALLGLAGIYLAAFMHTFSFGVDFTAYLEGAKAFLAGHDPYLKKAPPPDVIDIFPYMTRFLYPPVSLLWTGALRILPPYTTIVTWTVLSLIAFAAMLFLFGRHLKDAYKLPTAAAFALCAPWVVSYPFAHHLSLGQADIFVMALSAVFLWQAKKRPTLAGLCIATAILWKVYPAGIALIAFAAQPKQNLRSLAWAAGFGAVLTLAALFIVPLPYWKSWLSVTGFKTQFGNPYIVNQSIVATLQRFFDTRLGRVPLGIEASWAPIAFAKAGPFLFAASAIAFARLIPKAYQGDPLVLLAGFGVIYPIFASYWWIQQFIFIVPAMIFVATKMMEEAKPFPIKSLLLLAAACVLFAPWKDPAVKTDAGTFFGFILFHRFLLTHLIIAGLFFSTFFKMRNEKESQ